MSVSRKVFLLSMTVFIAASMLYCMLADRELFPFAPYTMYSYRQFPSMTYFKLYFIDGNARTELTSDDLSPLDEARIKTSLERTVSSPTDTLQKLKAVYLNYVEKRKNRPDLKIHQGISLQGEFWATLEALRKNQPTQVKEIAQYLP